MSIEPLWYGDWQELSCAGSESSLSTPCRFTLVAPCCHGGSIYTAEIGKLYKSENLPSTVRANLLVPTRWMALLGFLLPIPKSRTAVVRAQAVKNIVQLSDLDLPFSTTTCATWTSCNSPSSLTRLLSKSKETMQINTSLLTWYMCLRAQLFSPIPLFATPWTIACQAPLSMEFSGQEYWSGLPFPPPGDFPDARIKIQVFCVSCIADRFFTAEPLGKPNLAHGNLSINLLLLFCYYQCHCLGVLPKPFWVNKRKCLSPFCILHIGREELMQKSCVPVK